MKAILGKKIGMTTIYDKGNGALNVTLVECSPNKVVMLRNKERDGYSAVQMEISKTKNKTLRREFRIGDDESSKIKEGDLVGVSVFAVGEKVSVSGISKGKGFQGVMKRHNFSGSPHTHGHKHDWRAPGSVGAQQPQHVLKGKRMAGRMGGERISTGNLKIALVDEKKNLIAVEGSVPGALGSIIEITGA